MLLQSLTRAITVPVRQFRRRKSLGELVQGIRGKYSREKMLKEADADSRNTAQSGTNTNASAATSSVFQPLFVPNAPQNRHSLPVPIPERSASIPYESLLLSSVSSAPPRLDALPDFALDGFQKSSTFLGGLEKAVNDINTKYGDSTKTCVTSTSPTSSVAARDKNIAKARCMVPVYVDTSKPRPVIGELWTTLNSHGESLQPSKPLTGAPKDHVDTAYEADCSGAENNGESTGSDTGSPAITRPSTAELPESLPVAAADQPADDNQNTSISHLDNPVSNGADVATDLNCPDMPVSADIEAASSPPLAGDDSVCSSVCSSFCSKDLQNTSAVSHNPAPDQSSSVTNEIAGHGPPLEDPTPESRASRARNSSAPSVAALVSKFRRMEQSPDSNHQAEPREQDQVSVESKESNSRFIQSYRQRSEDSDNEDGLLSTVSSDNAGAGRPKVAVY